jgi:hypothetical protein
VFTNTRNGTSALASSGDQAMATPSATPTTPAMKKAPMISQVCPQMLRPGISPCHIAFHTRSGCGQEIFAMPVTLDGELPARAAHEQRDVGQYWRSTALFSCSGRTFQSD